MRRSRYVEPRWLTFVTNGIAPLPSVTSQGQRTLLGDTVSLRPPLDQCHYLTDPGIGHLWWWQRKEASVVEKSILDEYGAVARCNGALGVYLFSANRCDAGLALMLLRRRNVCGSLTPRRSTIFSRVQVTCTRNRALAWNSLRQYWIGALPRLRVSSLSYSMYSDSQF